MINVLYKDPCSDSNTLHSPQRDLDSNVAVDGNGQKTKYGALGQHQDEAGDEQTTVEIGTETSANHDGEGNGQHTHCDVRHGQRNNKEVGDALEVAVEAHCPADQHVAQDREQGNQQLQNHVRHVKDIVQHGELAGEKG